MRETDEIAKRIAVAAMDLAAERGWRAVDPAAAARRAGLSLAEVYRRAPSRADLLTLLSRIVDEAVLEGGSADDPEETPRDRLFDVMMRRYDALVPYRAGLKAAARALPADPCSLLALTPALGRSLAWMLRAAGIDADGPAGAARVAGLAAIHLKTLKVWFEDDTADLARTMASLDADLRRAEELAGTLRRAPRPPVASPAAAGA